MLLKTSYTILSLILISFALKDKSNEQKNKLPIIWVDSFQDDFSFRNNWSYKEGIYTNNYGQLSCDWFCPEGVEQMKINGKIIDDSLTSFYELVDTTHYFHSLKSEAIQYEYAGCDYIHCYKKDDEIIGATDITISTHSTLNLKIEKDSLEAWIIYNSITNMGERKFPLIKGNISIEKKSLKNGIIKAKFDFTFNNILDKEQELTWSGLIYSKIE